MNILSKRLCLLILLALQISSIYAEGNTVLSTYSTTISLLSEDGEQLKIIDSSNIVGKEILKTKDGLANIKLSDSEIVWVWISDIKTKAPIGETCPKTVVTQAPDSIIPASSGLGCVKDE